MKKLIENQDNNELKKAAILCEQGKINEAEIFLNKLYKKYQKIFFIRVLGIFIIFVVDSFSKSGGKYVR